MMNSHQINEISIPEMRFLCRRITMVCPVFRLLGRNVHIIDIHPDILPARMGTVPHMHAYYESHLILSGSSTYNIGKPQRLGPGAVLLHAPASPHGWAEAEEPWTRMLIWFKMDNELPVKVPQNWPTWPNMLDELYGLLIDSRAEKPGWRDRVIARMSLILSQILTLTENTQIEEVPQLTEVNLIRVIDEYLTDNLSHQIKIEDIAYLVNMKTRTLFRMYPSITGETIMDRLFNLRMKRAAELLTQSDMPVYEIGKSVGFPDASHFCRRFRTYFGTTPESFRG